MLIKNRRSWEISESLVTPEQVFLNRRGVLKHVGAAALAGALAACGDPVSSVAQPRPDGADVPDPSAGLYPFERNTLYTVDRPITTEQIVASYNNYYEFGDQKSEPQRNAQRLAIRPWEISIEGMVERPFTTDIDSLMAAMPLEERVYRHRCVERWSFTVPWSGFAMRAFIEYAKPTNDARYIVMKTFMNPEVAPDQRQIWYPWPYTEGLTLEEADNDLAFLVTGMYGKPLPKQNGAPLRLAVPWKYGFKSVKGINQIIFTDQRPVTFWEQTGPSEYGFWANVNPQVPHPRWTQASEEVLGTGEYVPTLLYNGYAEQVAGLYANMEGEELFK